MGIPRTDRIARFPLILHRDERGVISILSVFAVLILTALLGMVMNAGRQVDGKIRMQNAADSAAYSGAVVLARGMNTLAYTNHLLCDVFALTAFMREAEAQHSDKYIPDILKAWTKAGQIFQTSAFPKFKALGAAIVQKVPMEQELADSFSAWAKAASEIMLPTLEEILAQEMIPTFQRALLQACPDMAQQAAQEAARANGRPDFGRGDMLGVLWRTSAIPVGGMGEGTDPLSRTLPVVDPVGDMLPNQASFLADARDQRQKLAERYLGTSGPSREYWSGRGYWVSESWNGDTLWMFDHKAKMCQFAALWRGFTCGQLHKLLDENSEKNLPILIRTKKDDVADYNVHLDQDFTFVGVCYWRHVSEFAPEFLHNFLFRNPLQSDAMTYAQVRMFVPHRKLRWWHSVPVQTNQQIGGIPGDMMPLPPPGDGQTIETPPDPYPPDPTQQARWYVVREGQPEGNSEIEDWDLWNEHWTVALVPATVDTLVAILQEPPDVPGFDPSKFTLPYLPSFPGPEGTKHITRISPH
jgi:hypothetical protein